MITEKCRAWGKIKRAELNLSIRQYKKKFIFGRFDTFKQRSMIKFSLRLKSLINLIGTKEKAYKAKEITLKKIVDNKQQIRRAKQTHF